MLRERAKDSKAKEGGKELQGEERFFKRGKFWEESITQTLFNK